MHGSQFPVSFESDRLVENSAYDPTGIEQRHDGPTLVRVADAIRAF